MRQRLSRIEVPPRLQMWMAIGTAVLAIAAAGLAGAAFHKVSDIANDAQAKALVSCERTIKFGPPLADAYAKFKILSPTEIAAYRETIPKSCSQ